MSFLGLTTRKEMQALIEDAIKAEQVKYSPWLLQTADAEKYNMPDPSIYGNQADLYRTLSWITSAVGITADTVSIVPLSVMSAVGEDEPEAINNHPFELLLRHPNDEDSRSEFIYGSSAFWDLNGNCYWWLNKANEKATPDEMWIIPPHMIRAIPDGRMYLKGYLYYPGNGAEIFLQPWEICHFRRFNPFSRFTGLSAIESIALVAQGDLGMQNWNTTLFKENNARLPGIITFANMIEKGEWDKIKADTREAAKNRSLMMLRGVGQGDVKWLQNAVSQKDMEFLAGRAFNKSEIYGVLAPGLEAMTDPSATEANANAGERTFMAKKIWPMLVRMAEKIGNSILPAYGKNLIAEFEDVRISDRQLELQEMTEYAKSHTVKELRTKYYQDKPLGDERDDLFVTQVNAQTGKPEPEPAPVVVAPPQPEAKPETIQGEEPLEEVDEAEAENNALKADLDKWKRKALKHIGQCVPFESEVIPLDILSDISAKLPVCKTDTDVRALFVRRATKAHPISEAVMVMKGIEAALVALDKTQPMQLTINNKPSDPTPITFSPTIEAAKAADQPVPVVNVTVEQPNQKIEVKPADVTVVQTPAPPVKERKPRKVKVTRKDAGYEFEEE
jgi:phage portal protein BeeE